MSTKVAKFLSTLELQDTKLAHWGVKGMRWGIRRSDAELARASGESTDAIRARETLTSIQKSRSLATASDADLNHLVNRINLEKRYADINPSTATKGHNAIKTLLKAGDTMNKAISFANSDAGRLLASALGTKSRGRHARR